MNKTEALKLIKKELTADKKYKTKMLDFSFCPRCNARVAMMLDDLSISEPETDLKCQRLEALDLVGYIY